jgi:hypothetical protein
MAKPCSEAKLPVFLPWRLGNGACFCWLSQSEGRAFFDAKLDLVSACREGEALPRLTTSVNFDPCAGFGDFKEAGAYAPFKTGLRRSKQTKHPEKGATLNHLALNF